MRGLLKRDDPKLQASVASKHQVLLGSCLTAHASGASPSLGELPLRMHVRNEPIRRRLLSCGASAYAEAYIRWRHAALTPSSVAAARILGRPCLHPPHASPGLSSSCLRLVSIHYSVLACSVSVDTPDCKRKNGALETQICSPTVVFFALAMIRSV